MIKRTIDLTDPTKVFQFSETQMVRNWRFGIADQTTLSVIG